MRFGSLFTGIGGFDLGFERAGLECAWQVEIDGACQDVERRHWPNVKRFGDVRNVGKSNLDSVDLICGGFPCQDLSVAGKRAGLAGERSGLFWQMRRVIRQLKPQWVVIENVPGLLSSNAGRDFAAVIRGLVKCGYGVAWRVLDAQYFGVAQRRRRVFIVGSLGDGRAAQVLFEREGGAGDTPPSREAGARVTGPIADSSGKRGWSSSVDVQMWTEVAYTLPAEARGTGDGHGQGWNSNYVVSRDAVPKTADGLVTDLRSGNSHISAVLVNSFKKRGGFGWSQDEGIAQTLESEGGTHQGGPERVPLLAFQQNTRDEVRLMGGNGHFAGALAAEPGMKQQNYLASGFGVRRLTPTECERLQGFPDGWTEWGVNESGERVNQSDSTRYRQLGNAICVPVAEWIGNRLKETARHA